MKNRSKILFEFESKKYCLVKIEENNINNQIVIIFRDIPLHVTVHKDSSGLLRTIYYENKPLTSGGKARIDIAKQLGYKNPERQAKYLTQSYLVKCVNDTFGYHLISKSIELKKDFVQQKSCNLTIKVDLKKFLLEIYLSDDFNKYTGKNQKVLDTHLGELFFECREN